MAEVLEIQFTTKTKNEYFEHTMTVLKTAFTTCFSLIT